MGREAERTEAAGRHWSLPRPRLWQLWIDETPRPGWANMAIDQALLERAEQSGESWLRLYQWTPHCLSFGRHEPATRRYDAGRIAALGLDTVRRPTGGRAVWHARELTYAVAAPSAALRLASGRIPRDPRHARRGADLASGQPPQPGAAGPNPVARRRRLLLPAGRGRNNERGPQGRRQRSAPPGSALLQHGSILLQDNQDVVHQVTTGGPEPAVACRGGPVGSNAGRGRRGRRGGAAPLAGRWKSGSSHADILGSASAHFPHYRSAAWTWAR